MKHIIAIVLAICLALGISQMAFAAVQPVPTGNELSPDGHTDVIIWITDGKNLPDVNGLNPVLTVQVKDEKGQLIPNATVTLHLVNPNLTNEIVVKSSGKNQKTPSSTTPNTGTAPTGDEISYEVFGPNSPNIQYEIRANAPNFRETVTNPFQITFSKTGTIEVVLKARVANDFTINYKLRTGDDASIAFSRTDVKRGNKIGTGNIPKLILSQAPKKWKLDGYYINGVRYTAAQLADFVPTADTEVEIRTFPDDNNDDVDDRRKTTDYNVDFHVRAGDSATLDFTKAVIQKGNSLTAAKVPTVSGLPADWVFDGFFINNAKYSAATLAAFVPTADTVVEVRTFPDTDGDGVDDRLGQKQYTVDYHIRPGDLGTLNFHRAVVNAGDELTIHNVPTVSQLPSNWKVVGYSVHGRVYTAQELARMRINQDMVDMVMTMPDKNNNGVDDRGGSHVPKTGAEDSYGNYIIGFSISLLLLLIMLIWLILRIFRDTQNKNPNKF
ncbi:MAG: hypothetical protein RSB78_01030 [Oscillospiraceae bacterium]